MNIFDKAKSNQDDGSKKCFHCENKFIPDKRNLKRGWGLFCSKSCSQKHLILLKIVSKEERKSILRDKRLTQLGIF